MIQALKTPTPFSLREKEADLKILLPQGEGFRMRARKLALLSNLCRHGSQDWGSPNMPDWENIDTSIKGDL